MPTGYVHLDRDDIGSRIDFGMSASGVPGRCAGPAGASLPDNLGLTATRVGDEVVYMCMRRATSGVRWASTSWPRSGHRRKPTLGRHHCWPGSRPIRYGVTGLSSFSVEERNRRLGAGPPARTQLTLGSGRPHHRCRSSSPKPPRSRPQGNGIRGDRPRTDLTEQPHSHWRSDAPRSTGRCRWRRGPEDECDFLGAGSPLQALRT